MTSSYKKYVVHCMKEPHDIYIGRWHKSQPNESIWHNPYKVGTREEKIAKFKEYLSSNSTLCSKLYTLRNKKLGCWCSPEDCHGDILAEYANKYEQIIVRNFWETVPVGYMPINVTSKSDSEWSRMLSPFFLGPIEINGKVCQNVENAWQYSKVYPEHADSNGEPTTAYYLWRDNGYALTKAERYPMGKKVRPLYSLVNDVKYPYLEAKEKIYIKIYSEAVSKTESYGILTQLAKEGRNLCLLDFDAYDHTGKTKKEIIDHPTRKFGHGFCIKWLLDEELRENDK